MWAPLNVLVSRCGSLRTCSRELWLIYVVKALESYSYFSLSIVYVVYLTDNFGISDVSAGASYGIWGTLCVVWGIALGPAIDWLGVRYSLILCFTLEGLSRAAMAVTHSKGFLYFLAYGPMPAAGALGIPVMTIGVKRYTTVEARGLAFGLFYTVMNVAALLNGLTVDALRIGFRDGFQIDVPSTSVLAFLNDGNRLVIASGVLSSLLGVLVSLYISPAAEMAGDKGSEEAGRDVDGIFPVHAAGPELEVASEFLVAADPTHVAAPRALPDVPADFDGSSCALDGSGQPRVPLHMLLLASLRDKARVFASRLEEMSAYPDFWKYLVMSLFMLNLRQTFRYLDSVLPKYMQRRLGCDAPMGTVYSINPAMIIVLVPLVAACTGHVPHFDMIHWGSFVSASSSFWVPFMAAQAVGGIAGPVIFVVQLSLGEAIWSPRWYDYTMDVAPVGREGLFGALSSAPLFLAKLPTGLLSGYLLEAYCPNARPCGTGDDDAEAPGGAAGAAAGAAGDSSPCKPTLWTVIGALTMMSPILVTLFRTWLKPTTYGHEGYGPMGVASDDTAAPSAPAAGALGAAHQASEAVPIQLTGKPKAVLSDVESATGRSPAMLAVASYASTSGAASDQSMYNGGQSMGESSLLLERATPPSLR